MDLVSSLLGLLVISGEVFAAICDQILFGYESNDVELGARFVFSCLSNESEITMSFRKWNKEPEQNLNCSLIETSDNQYNCTLVEETFGYSNVGRYRCSVTLSNGIRKAKSVEFFARVGIFAHPPKLGVLLGSRATLSCDSEYLHVQFQKLSSGSTPVNITKNSSNHMLLVEYINITSGRKLTRTTLTFLKFRQSDAGVYRCQAVENAFVRTVHISNMTVYTEGSPGTNTVSSGVPPTVSSGISQVSVPSIFHRLASSVSTGHSTRILSPSPTVSVSPGHSTRILSPSPTVSVSPDSSLDGLGAGAIGGIVVAGLLIVIVVIVIVICALQQQKQPKKQSVMTEITYDNVVASKDNTGYLTQHAELLCSGCSIGKQNKDNSLMQSAVVTHKFGQNQVIGGPVYDCPKAVHSEVKAMPSNLETAQISPCDQSTMQSKLNMSYAKPDLNEKTKKRQTLVTNDSSQSQGSHAPDSPHIYDRLTGTPTGEITKPSHYQVASLPIYGTADEISRHFKQLAKQSTIEHKEDLNPDLILSSNESASSLQSSIPYQSVYADPAPLLKAQGPPEMTSHNFSQHKMIGKGQFGDVYQAFTKNVLIKKFTDGQQNSVVMHMPVALKYLRDGATKDMKKMFNKEVKFMASLQHPHVVGLLGVCSTEQPKFMVIEYMENGDLNQYLHNFELDKQFVQNGQELISYDVLTDMAADVASGMEYLASKSFVHRDLATRNCLVGNNHLVKIADFGMARSLYEKNYYRMVGQAILPVRWMAPECFYGKFTVMSDIWSFGVTCWEIFTLARALPYVEMEDKEVIKNAIHPDGPLLLECPDCCDHATFQLMTTCWSLTPKKRPSFTILCSQLRSLAEKHRKSGY